MIKAPKINNDQ